MPVDAKPKTAFLTGLILGDLLALLAVTLLGFIFHGEGIPTPRWLTTFVPVCAAWALQAPWLGLYRREIALNLRQAGWRAALATILAAPMAGLLRAMLLGSTVIPIFVIVLALTGALGMALWRTIYVVRVRRLEKYG